MLVTLFGIVIDVRALHLKKAQSPMLVTLFGMVTDVRDSHPEKAELPILVTPSGIGTLPMGAISVLLLRLTR